MSKKYILYGIRAFIVLGFLFVIALFLYAPRIYNYFLYRDSVLTIYISRQTVPEETFLEFEKKTGVRVRIAYFDSNEELLAKLKINRGVGYDLIVSSDYMVELLRKDGLLQRLDHTKLSRFKKLDQRLMNKFFDPGNQYTVPLSWIPYGIAYNRSIINLDGKSVSWDIIFKPEVLKKLGNYKVSMLNDAREVIFLGAIYLFGSVDNLTPERLKEVQKLLVNQRPIVESYTETGAKYLLFANIVPLAVLPAARLKEMGDLKNFGFVIPKEGSLIDVLNIGISVSCKQPDVAHKLIDFLTSKAVSAYNFEVFDCNPSNTEAFSLIDRSYFLNKAFFPDKEMFERLHILHNQIRPGLLEKVWFSVKSV
ncbi:spermidine/putrescine ABC transporter substrate-binding protein [Candidatus Dependentiae bacterium]|nr:spermidine/putrescine ABC transporter substrate-binding protein [Candidatus Dependentiae bacterium]